MTVPREARDELRRKHAALAVALSDEEGFFHPFESLIAQKTRSERNEAAGDNLIPLLDSLDAAEAERDRLHAALLGITVHSAASTTRTLGEASDALYWCHCHARAALSASASPALLAARDPAHD